MLTGKKIVLGITGSIAAYKACQIIRLLIKNGAEVQVVITPSGKEFITPITLSTLTQKPVISEFFSQRDGTWNSHVDIGLWADLMLIAPCSASTLGKMANGVADNMLITTYLSMKAPVMIAPAMDLDMYAHPSTKRNLDILHGYGNYIIEPQSGFLASGLEGKGRMEEPETIVEQIKQFFNKKQSLKGKQIMINAGPTYEKIDPVRYISNHSTGKMGVAIANECCERGANVTLVLGPISKEIKINSKINIIHVETAEEMFNASKIHFLNANVAILTAAVADFTPETTADKKIKRLKDDLCIKLKPTKDIAAELGKIKKDTQKIVGFALETNDEEANAKDKLKRKNLDFIVLNSLKNKGTCFQSDENKIMIINENNIKQFTQKSKTEVAKDIINELESIL